MLALDLDGFHAVGLGALTDAADVATMQYVDVAVAPLKSVGSVPAGLPTDPALDAAPSINVALADPPVASPSSRPKRTARSLHPAGRARRVVVGGIWVRLALSRVSTTRWPATASYIRLQRSCCTTATTAGGGAVSGARCSSEWLAPAAFPRSSRSTPPTSISVALWGGNEGSDRDDRALEIHALADALGRSVAFVLTPGNIADSIVARAMLAMVSHRVAGSAKPMIPMPSALDPSASDPLQRRRTRPLPLDRHACKRRNLIGRMFWRLKDWRRIATRYDRRADNFLAASL